MNQHNTTQPTQRKPLIVCKEHCSYNVSNVTIIIVNADDVMKMEMIMVWMIHNENEKGSRMYFIWFVLILLILSILSSRFSSPSHKVVLKFPFHLWLYDIIVVVPCMNVMGKMFKTIIYLAFSYLVVILPNNLTSDILEWQTG